MSYRKLLRYGAYIFAASLVSLTACKRGDKTVTPSLSTEDDKGGYATDAATMERNGNDATTTADEAVTTNTSSLRTTTAYPVITRSVSGTDTTVTIDFGPTDHLCRDMRTRRGEILVTYSGRYKDSGSHHTISFNNYYVDGFQLKGYRNVTNQGMNTSGQYWYDVEVHDTLVVGGGDSIITVNGSRTRTWYSGYGSTDRSDDVYLIGGSTTLRRANGHVFTFTISSTDPLKVALACRWIEAGTVTISSSTFVGGDRTVDYSYGTGGCDDQAKVTIGSHTYYITLH